MTIGAGHPDWQAYAQWRSGALLNVSPTIAPSGVYVSPAMNIANWQTVFLDAAAIVTGSTLTVQVAADVNAADADWYNQQVIVLPYSGCAFLAPITPLNRAIRLRVENSSATTNETVRLRLYGLNVPPVQGTAQQLPNLVNVQNLSLANNAVSLLVPPYQGCSRMQGFVSFNVAPASGFTATLWTLNADGTINEVIAGVACTAKYNPLSLVTGTGPMGLRVTNQTGATVNGIYASLAGAP